jgi:hypothetical protein
MTRVIRQAARPEAEKRSNSQKIAHLRKKVGVLEVEIGILTERIKQLEQLIGSITNATLPSPDQENSN